LLRLATQQYRGLACEAQLLLGLEDVFKLLNTLLQEAQLKKKFRFGLFTWQDVVG